MPRSVSLCGKDADNYFLRGNMNKSMKEFLEQVENVKEANVHGGGLDKIEQQHAKGALTARERIDLLADKGSFVELGSFADELYPPLDGTIRPSPCDGVVVGTARVNGRMVGVYATDFTVMSGAMGEQSAWKIADIIELAGKTQIPVIGMLDTVGLRFSLQQSGGGFQGLTKILRNQTLYSGVIPQLQLVLGPCIGMMSLTAVMGDFLIANRNNSLMWLGGAMDSEESGNADYQMKHSGQCDIVAKDDTAAIQKVKELLGYIPQNCWEKPPIVENSDDIHRRDDELLDVLPEDSRFTYDVHEVIEKIVDDGQFFEIKKDYAPNLVLGFCRFGGRPVGLVANNPEELAGALEPDSSDKYYRFLMFLDAFNIPMLNMIDTTAFIPGDEWERRAVLRHGAKLLHAYSIATIPKITLIMRRAYGGANLVMGSKGMGCDLAFGWPTGEMAPAGPEAVLGAVFHRELAEAKEKGKFDEVYNFYLDRIRKDFSVMSRAQRWSDGYSVHEVIDPRDTRSRIVRAVEMLWNKQQEIHDKKYGIEPP